MFRRTSPHSVSLPARWQYAVRGLLLFAVLVWSGSPLPTAAQVITEMIDGTGDGSGNVLDGALGIAVDEMGNVYVAGFFSDNAFQITPGGLITKIIDSTGDSSGNALDGAVGIAVDGAGNVYVSGFRSNNAFQVQLPGMITKIFDSAGDGSGAKFVET